MTVTSPLCATFFGQQFNDVKSSVDALADVIRYETIDAQGSLTAEVDFNDIPSSYVLTDITALSDTSYLVAYDADTFTRPVHPNCQ